MISPTLGQSVCTKGPDEQDPERLTATASRMHLASAHLYSAHHEKSALLSSSNQSICLFLTPPRSSLRTTKHSPWRNGECRHRHAHGPSPCQHAALDVCSLLPLLERCAREASPLSSSSICVRAFNGPCALCSSHFLVQEIETYVEKRARAWAKAQLGSHLRSASTAQPALDPNHLEMMPPDGFTWSDQLF